MTKVFAEVYMHCKLNTKQPVLHTYSLLRTSHCNDLGVTLWIRQHEYTTKKKMRNYTEDVAASFIN